VGEGEHAGAEAASRRPARERRDAEDDRRGDVEAAHDRRERLGGERPDEEVVRVPRRGDHHDPGDARDHRDHQEGGREHPLGRQA
jgi:hypothetical protein